MKEPCDECGETDPEFGVKLREDGKVRCDECQEFWEEAEGFVNSIHG